MVKQLVELKGRAARYRHLYGSLAVEAAALEMNLGKTRSRARSLALPVNSAYQAAAGLPALPSTCCS